MRAALLVFSLATWSAPLAAQRSLQGPAPSMLFGYGPVGGVKSLAAGPSDSLKQQIRPTYWKEGALIGGALGALLGAAAGHGLCEGGDEATKHCTGALVLGGVFGAALVAIPGALIGGQFSKEAAERPGRRTS
jgi:hypothetical protein